MSNRNDADLLELSGYWVYQDEKEIYTGAILNVNGNSYEVLDVKKGANGLDAMTVVNTTTGEVTVVYQGTAGLDDVLTDGELVTELTPKQYDEAVEYYNDAKEIIKGMKTADGKIDYVIKYVAGNSLGGGLANYVATKYGADSIFSVTLDPAPIPYGITPGTNAINYVANTSPLYLACLAAGYVPNRFPGQFSYVEYGMFSFLLLAENHVGYKGESDGVGIDDVIPFSIWDNNTILQAGGSSGMSKININSTTLEQLTKALGDRVKTIKTELIKYLDPVYEDIAAEKNNLMTRKQDISTETDEITSGFFSITDNTTQHLVNISTILTGMNFGYSLVNFDPIDGIIRQYHLWKFTSGIPKMLEDATAGYEDGFVNKLEEHHRIIDVNLQGVIKKWEYVSNSAHAIKDSFKLLDETIKNRISTGNMSAGDIMIAPIDNPKILPEESKEFKAIENAVDEKQRQLNKNFKVFKFDAVNLLNDILNEVSKIIQLVRIAIRAGIAYFKNGLQQIDANINDLNKELIGTDTEEYTRDDFAQTIADAEANLKELNRLMDLTESLRENIKAQRSNIGEIIEGFKPYFNHLLFRETKYGEIQTNVQASLFLVKNSGLIFNEIWSRIAETECDAIEQLRTEAKNTSNLLQNLEKQLEIIAL